MRKKFEKDKISLKELVFRETRGDEVELRNSDKRRYKIIKEEKVRHEDIRINGNVCEMKSK